MKKRIISLFIAVVMLASVFSLNVAAEGIADDMAELMAMERASYHTEFDLYGHQGGSWAHADEYYAYAYIECYSRSSNDHDFGVSACAHVENAIDYLDGRKDGYKSASIDITLGELQGANDYPMVYSRAATYLGSYDIDIVHYYGY